MNDRTVEIFRTCLTVVGIFLLVLFGSRAAAQAQNMRLAGANHRSIFAIGTDIMSILGFGKADSVTIFEPRPISTNVPPQIQTATPITTAASGSNGGQSTLQSSTNTTQSKSSKGLHKAVGTVTKTQQTVSNIAKNTSNDFTNLWP